MVGVIQSALSGLLANSQKIATSANNIANQSTPGFKASRVGLESIDPATGGGVRPSQQLLAGDSGVVAQTRNPLDLAVQGNGFFAVDSGGSDSQTRFTRDGSFSTNAQGELTNGAGQRLLGFNIDQAGNEGNELQPIKVSRGTIAPQATSEVSADLNLDSRVDASGSDTDFTRSVRVFDSLGTEQSLKLNFDKTATNEFELSVTDGQGTTVVTETLQFDGSGQLTSPSDGQVQLNNVDFNNGSAQQDITLDLAETTQFAGEFTTRSVTQNGTGPGNFDSVSVAEDGTVTANFANGRSQAVARAPVATFANPQGLQQAGNNAFTQTEASGPANLRTAGTGGSGPIQSGRLERSNVSLSQELVTQQLAETAFKANLQSLQAQQENTDRLLDVLE
jgi:flagellar hook protein FlgE